MKWLTDSQKNGLLVGLALLVVVLALYAFKNPSSPGVHPSLVPVNVSSDKQRPEYKSPYEQNQVRNTILKNNSLIQECYLKHLEQKNATSAGKIQVDWQIAPDGTVLSPQVVASTLNDKSMDTCVLEKLKTFLFPPPPSDKPVYTTFSYLFRKQEESFAPQLVPVTKEPTNK